MEDKETIKPTTTNQNPTLVLSLNLQEVNVIISALQEISYKLADPVLKKLVPQAQEQLKQYQ